jgi:hypothetical protein
VFTDKATRVLNFHQDTLKALKELLAAAGLRHPSELGPEHVIRRASSSKVRSLAKAYHWLLPGELITGARAHAVYTAFWEASRPDSFEPPVSLTMTRGITAH